MAPLTSEPHRYPRNPNTPRGSCPRIRGSGPSSRQGTMGQRSARRHFMARLRRWLGWRHIDTLFRATGWLYVLFWLLLLVWSSTTSPTQTWSWLAFAGWTAGPMVGLLLLAPPIRARRSSLKLILRAVVAGSLAFAGLSYSIDPQFASLLFVGLAGPAWALWLVHRVDERETAEDAVRQSALAEQRHREVMRALRRGVPRDRRVAGARRKA